MPSKQIVTNDQTTYPTAQIELLDFFGDKLLFCSAVRPQLADLIPIWRYLREYQSVMVEITPLQLKVVENGNKEYVFPTFSKLSSEDFPEEGGLIRLLTEKEYYGFSDQESESFEEYLDPNEDEWAEYPNYSETEEDHDPTELAMNDVRELLQHFSECLKLFMESEGALTDMQRQKLRSSLMIVSRLIVGWMQRVEESCLLGLEIKWEEFQGNMHLLLNNYQLEYDPNSKMLSYLCLDDLSQLVKHLSQNPRVTEEYISRRARRHQFKVFQFFDTFRKLVHSHQKTSELYPVSVEKQLQAQPVSNLHANLQDLLSDPRLKGSKHSVLSMWVTTGGISELSLNLSGFTEEGISVKYWPFEKTSLKLIHSSSQPAELRLDDRQFASIRRGPIIKKDTAIFESRRSQLIYSAVSSQFSFISVKFKALLCCFSYCPEQHKLTLVASGNIGLVEDHADATLVWMEAKRAAAAYTYACVFTSDRLEGIWVYQLNKFSPIKRQSRISDDFRWTGSMIPCKRFDIPIGILRYHCKEKDADGCNQYRFGRLYLKY